MLDLTTPCEHYPGTVNGDGYGQITIDGVTYLAHRIAFQLHVGTIPRGWMVDHACRVPICINWQHLRLATNKQNQENREVTSYGVSGLRGVVYLKHLDRYRAQVRHNGKLHTFGSYQTPEEAAAVVATKRAELFTHSEG